VDIVFCDCVRFGLGLNLWNLCNLWMNRLELSAFGEQEGNQRRIDQAKE
jgi:hypothetical protein